MRLAWLLSPHERLRDDLSSYVDGRLSGDDLARFTAHLADCTRCSQDVVALRATRDLMRAMPLVTVRRSFVVRAAATSSIAPTRPRLFFALRNATGAMAALLVVVVVNLVGHGDQVGTFGTDQTGLMRAAPEALRSAPIPAAQPTGLPKPAAAETLAKPAGLAAASGKAGGETRPATADQLAGGEPAKRDAQEATHAARAASAPPGAATSAGAPIPPAVVLALVGLTAAAGVATLVVWRRGK
jgi:anti-sigma factor RsiW